MSSDHHRKGVKLKLGPLCVNARARSLFRDFAKRAHEVRTAAHLLVKHYVLVRLRRGEAPPPDLHLVFKAAVKSLGTKPLKANAGAELRQLHLELRALLASDFPRSADGARFSLNVDSLTRNWATYTADLYVAQVGTHLIAHPCRVVTSLCR